METNAKATNPSRWLAAALLGVGLTIAGPFLWVALLDVPLLRTTALPMWVAMSLGALAGLLAWRRDRRVRTRLPAGVSVCCLIIAVPCFLWFTSLPRASEVDEVAGFTDLALPDHNGRPVPLASFASDRAALLVFYRGFW